MNSDQTAHLNNVLERASRLIEDKYIKGAAEHQTTLNKDHSVLQLLEFAIEEAVDQITYLLTLEEQLRGN